MTTSLCLSSFVILVIVRFGSTDPCQSCTSDLDCSFVGMEFCNLPTSTADDTTSFDDFRNYASPIDPRLLRSNPTTANYRFTQCQDLVGYLFGLNLEAMPNSCQLRQEFILGWVAMAALVVLMLLCCICQCCCCSKCGSTTKGSAGRENVVILRA